MLMPQHFEVERCNDETKPINDKTVVTVRNFGNTLLLTNGKRLRRGTTGELTLPVSLWIGHTVIRLFEKTKAYAIDDCISHLPSAQSQDGLVLFPDSSHAPASNTLVEWFQTFLEMQKDSPLGNDQHRKDYYHRAAQAIFDPGGFDGGFVIKKQGDRWVIAASYLPHPNDEIAYRYDLLMEAFKTKTTLFHDATKLAKQREQPGHQTSHDCSVAVSPIFDQGQQVTGFVYGVRYQHKKNSRVGIRQLEAHFLGLVAQAISNGEIRATRDEEIAASNSLLKRVFPEEVARQMRDDPSVLSGRNKEVTVLFADMRGYSTLVNQAEPQTTFHLISEVMERWTQIVTRLGGAILDYYGDGLTAFWNAPVDTPNHAALAVQCAFEIRESLAPINRNWAHLIGQSIDAGIGVATGEALVGNCGSRTRVKYGPHGAIVNLASRLESATKILCVPILISEATAQKVEKSFAVRRLLKARLKGFHTPLFLYQPRPIEDTSPQEDWFEQFEDAIQQIESNELELAEASLQQILRQTPNNSIAQSLVHLVHQHATPPLEIGDATVTLLAPTLSES